MSLWIILSLIFWLGCSFILATFDYEILKKHDQVNSNTLLLVIIDALFWPLRLAAVILFACVAAISIMLATFIDVIKTLMTVVFARK